MKKNTTVFYHEWWPLVSTLTLDNQALLFDLLFNDNNTNHEIEDLHLKGIYFFIKSKIDENNKKFMIRCEANKINGSKGGRPKDKKPKITQNNPTITENNPKEKEKEKEKEEEKDNEELRINNQNNFNLFNLNPDTELIKKQRKDYTPISPNPKERKNPESEAIASSTKKFFADFSTLSDEHQKLTIGKYTAIRKSGINHEQVLDWLLKFDEFWEHYTPIRNSKGKCVARGDRISCRITYLRILWKENNHEEIMEGLKSYLEFCKASDQLTVMVSTFLNQERWKEDYSRCMDSAKPVKEAPYIANLRENMQVINEAIARHEERERLKREAS